MSATPGSQGSDHFPSSGRWNWSTNRRTFAVSPVRRPVARAKNAIPLSIGERLFFHRVETFRERAIVVPPFFCELDGELKIEPKGLQTSCLMYLHALVLNECTLYIALVVKWVCRVIMFVGASRYFSISCRSFDPSLDDDVGIEFALLARNVCIHFSIKCGDPHQRRVRRNAADGELNCSLRRAARPDAP